MLQNSKHIIAVLVSTMVAALVSTWHAEYDKRAGYLDNVYGASICVKL